MNLSFTQSKEKDQSLLSIEMSLKVPSEMTQAVTELVSRSKLTSISLDAPAVQAILCWTVSQALEQLYPPRTISSSEQLLWNSIRRTMGSALKG